MISVTTINVNGIRVVKPKALLAWLDKHEPDVVLIQEARAPAGSVKEILGERWNVVEIEAPSKGRAGVAVASRLPILASSTTMGSRRFKHNGRWIEAVVELPTGERMCCVSTYVFTGEANDEQRMEEKLAFLAAMVKRMTALRREHHHVLVAGDLNVAHREVDIKNWKGNRNKAGFLLSEREYLDQLGRRGWVDLGRALGGEGPGPYTWWSYRGFSYDNDAGWRIDYQIASPELARCAIKAEVDRSFAYAERWSDHSPLTVHFDLSV